MKKYTMRFRSVDRSMFQEIKNGLKTVETRAASTRYRDIKEGDEITLVCGTKRITKRVKRTRHFESIAAMFRVIPLKKIMPSVSTQAQAQVIYYGYPGYREKIKRFGIVALELK